MKSLVSHNGADGLEPVTHGHGYPLGILLIPLIYRWVLLQGIHRSLVAFVFQPTHYPPLEMCAVGGLVRRGAQSNVWRVTKFPVCLP